MFDVIIFPIDTICNWFFVGRNIEGYLIPEDGCVLLLVKDCLTKQILF